MAHGTEPSGLCPQTQATGQHRLHRRRFLTAAAAAFGSAVVSRPALADGSPFWKWLPSVLVPGEKMPLPNPLKDIIPKAHLAGIGGQVYSGSGGLAFSADGKLLASRGGDKTVKVWSLPDGRPVTMLEGHKEQVQHADFSPDSKLLASGDVSGVILLWEMGTSKRCWVLFDPKLPPE